MPPIPSARWFRLLLGACVALFAAALIGASAQRITERMWAQSMGFGASFDRRLQWWAATWSIALIFSFAALFGSLRRVDRMARVVFGDAGRVRTSVRAPVVVAGAVAVAPLLGDRWREAMLAVTGWRERVNGPTVLGVDPGFYVFRLPLLQAVTTWLIALCALCFVATLVAGTMCGLVFRSGRGVGASTPAVLRLLMVPFIVLCGLVAVGLWWARFAFASRANGSLVGLFGLQNSIVVPMLSVLAMGAIAIGFAVVPTLRRGHVVDHSSFDLWDELLLARVGVVIWLVAAVIGILIIPAAAQSSQPLPRSSEREALIRHFAATITAYDLDDVVSEVADGAARPVEERAGVGVSGGAGSGRPMVELIRSATAARDEVVPDNSSAVSGSGGLLAPEPVLARTGSPLSASSAGAVNDAAIGVSVSRFWQRLAFAARFGDLSLLRGGAITHNTVLVHHRDAVDRAHALAPFLRFASHPYTLEFGGDTVWVVDAFTTSNAFPGAQRFSVGARSRRDQTLLAGHLNYVRNSVTVLVDARTGRTRFYRTDLTDPVARTWARALPGLLRSPKAMDIDYPGIGSMVRYPDDLLSLQALALGAYHSRKPADIVDPTTRWNVADLGSVDQADVGETLYAKAGERSGLPSAVRVLEPVKTPALTRYVLVGRAGSVGREPLTIDPLTGARAVEVRALIDKNRVVVALREAIGKVKRSPLFGPLVPVNAGRYGIVYAQSASSQDATRKSLGDLRPEGLVLGGSDGVVVGRDADQVWERYVALGSSAPVTVPNAAEIDALRAAVEETQRRLTESESVIDSLRRRVSVLESAEQTTIPTSAPTAQPR